MKFAELDTDKRNALNDSDFAYIDSNGERHLPIHDAAHVRNALARWNQTHFESPVKKAEALKKIKAKAKSLGIDTPDEKNKAMEMMITQLLEFDEPVSGSNVSEIEILKAGEWDHPTYGKMIITQEMLDEFKMNFDNQLRKGVYITEGHPTGDEELPAVGWFKELKKKGSDVLVAVVEWNKKGMDLLADKLYKFFSPEFYFAYEDPETREITKNVLTGGALTNKPYFKSLQAIVMSEKYLINKDKKMFDLEKVKAKELDDLTSEEKEGLKVLFDEGKLENDLAVKFQFADKPGTDQEDEDAEDDDGENKMSETEEKACEKMSEADKNKFKKMSKADRKAFMSKQKASEQKEKDEKEKLEMTEKDVNKKLEMAEKEIQKYQMKERELIVENGMGKVIASETNKLGSFLPKQKDDIKEFAMKLNAEDCKKFFSILEGAKKSQLFDEAGSGEDGPNKFVGKSKDGTPIDAESDAIAKRADAIMASDKKVNLEQALVMAEKELAK